jgi:hypothetical protein
MLNRTDEILHTRENCLACMLGIVTASSLALFFLILWLYTGRPNMAAAALVEIFCATIFTCWAQRLHRRLQDLE